MNTKRFIPLLLITAVALIGVYDAMPQRPGNPGNQGKGNQPVSEKVQPDVVVIPPAVPAREWNGMRQSERENHIQKVQEKINSLPSQARNKAQAFRQRLQNKKQSLDFSERRQTIKGKKQKNWKRQKTVERNVRRVR